jgi:hypothetical protein
MRRVVGAVKDSRFAWHWLCWPGLVVTDTKTRLRISVGRDRRGVLRESMEWETKLAMVMTE